jgi:hypothetical protein
MELKRPIAIMMVARMPSDFIMGSSIWSLIEFQSDLGLGRIFVFLPKL